MASSLSVLKNKAVLRMFFGIALPIALQNLLNFAVGFMDMVMVGALGEEQLSAVTVANQPFQLFMYCLFGLSSGAGVLISQYWGKNDRDTISKVFGIAIKLSMIVGLAVMLVMLFFPEPVMRVFTNEESVIPYGLEYLQVVAFSYIFFAFTSSYLNCIRNVERVRIAVITYSISFFVNVFFNYMFIFGKFGAPELGVKGAAVGTLIARIVEFVIVFVYAFKVEKRIRLRWRYIFKSDKTLLHDFTRISLPVVANEMMWAAAVSAQMAIIGRMGVVAMASVSVVINAVQIMMAVAYGAASATLVITGKYIGARDYETARKGANALVLLNILIAAASAAALVLLRPGFIWMYSINDSLSAATIGAINETLLVAAALMIFQSIATSCIVGVFRGGGDTLFAMWMDIISTWVISVPLGALGGLVWGFSIPLTFLMIRADEIIKAIICLFRLKGGKWLKNVTRDASGKLADGT